MQKHRVKKIVIRFPISSGDIIMDLPNSWRRLIRNQQVGGSNPLSGSIDINNIQGSEKRKIASGGRSGRRKSVHWDISLDNLDQRSAHRSNLERRVSR